MKQTANLTNQLSLFCGGIAVALGLSFAQTATAQRPVLNAAASHTALRPVMAARSPELAAPEPPQAAQNTPPVKDDLFAGTEKFAKGASDVTEVDMDPNSLDLVGGPDSHRAHNMVLSVVRTYTYDKPGMYNPADVEEYRHKLETGDWHCSVHTRDSKSGESTDVCSRRRAPDMVEHAIITVSPKSLTFVHNIRKANGQGGGLYIEGLPGMALMIPGLSPMQSMRLLQPELQAEMTASRAAMQGWVDALTAETHEFRFELTPEQEKQFDSLKDFHFKLTPEQTLQMQKLGKDFKFEFTPEQRDQFNKLKNLHLSPPEMP